MVCRCPHHQRHKPRHQRRDRTRQELPEPRGHHRQVQGGHLLLRQGAPAPGCLRGQRAVSPVPLPSGRAESLAVSLSVAQAVLPRHHTHHGLPPIVRVLRAEACCWEAEGERWAACRFSEQRRGCLWAAAPEVPGRPGSSDTGRNRALPPRWQSPVVDGLRPRV